jgi:serine/threonine protein kinase
MLRTGRNSALWKVSIQDLDDARERRVTTSHFLAVKVVIYDEGELKRELRAQYDEEVLSVSLATCNREVSQRETEIMRRLSHDHIVRFIGADTFSEGDLLRVNICMELFHCDMASFIDNPATTTTAKSIASFARQICLGLDYIHHEGVVHCDIKPQNILVNDQGNLVKIADFGNAVELELEHTNNHVSTYPAFVIRHLLTCTVALFCGYAILPSSRDPVERCQLQP